ncbi:hypothetical protein NW754_002868 [Fusarium falciforme]|nr:hypothetical protein NW754_002868 [Fusarium falciforme]
MTDPFSIIGLLGVAAQFIQLAVDFGRDWRDVPEDTKALITKLQGLKAVLSVTHINILIDPDLHDIFLGRRAMNLSQPGIGDLSMTMAGMVSSCKTGLEDLLKVLRQCEKGHRVGWQRITGAFNAKPTRDRVEDLHRRCEILNNMVSINFQAETYNVVKATREEQRDWRQSEENKAVLAWLSGPSFEDTHRAVFTKRHPDTGQWFLNKDEFKQWRDSQSNTTSALWCPGMPGAGKTVISSVVIDHLRQQCNDPTIGIAFVYCDYKDRLNQTPSNLLSSLARQLARRKQVLPKEVKDLYNKHAKNETIPSLDEYSTLFSQLVTSFSKTFIIVDGLDEHVGEEDDGSLNMEFVDRELLIALALRLDDNDLDEDAKPFDSLIASLTAGLLTMEPTLTGQDKTVRLAHFTVAEYFKDEGSQYLIYTEEHLAKICLNYLLFKNMEPNLRMRQSHQRYGFYNYAANNWGHHVQAASTIDQDSVMTFLRNEDKAKACCTALNKYLNWPESKPLYLTAYFQLEKPMRVLIAEGCNINAATPNGWTLLLSFVERGQEAVVTLLLNNGADINPRAKQSNITLREPLAIAAEQGNQTMVRLLLDRGADPNAEVQGGQEIRMDRTVPLVNAAKNGHIEIVEMLLGTEGIRINEMVVGNMTAYYWAIRRRDLALARLLQSRGGTF